MSGIVALLNRDAAPVDAGLLREMTMRLAFRGPDDQNTWQEGAIGLGHALLRTTFEAEGEHSPCSLDGRTWITASARVDDRARLLDKLHDHGRELPAQAPDPHLILAAYQVWGEACLEHLAGDFAFILWDASCRRLLCARDHFGVAPLYFAEAGPSLVLSNTLQAVRLHPRVSDALNEQAIGDYLLFHCNFDPNTSVFADVRRLPPAHALTWDARAGLQIRRYWDLAGEQDYMRYKDPRDYVVRFGELFGQAVADRLRTDRVTIALSGGMDSPAVAAAAHGILAAQGRPCHIQALTFVHRLTPTEEERYASLVAEKLGIPIEFIDSDARLYKEPPESFDGVLSPEPNSVFACWLNPWQELWSRAAAGRVLLTGHGGDPALRASKTYWRELLVRGQFGQMVADIRQYRHTLGRWPRLRLRRPARGRKIWPYPPWLNPDFAARLELPRRQQSQGAGWGYRDGLLSMARNPFWANFLSSFDAGNTLLPLEVRFPFFDLRLVSYLATVPPAPWFEGKYLLRAAMRPSLPAAVSERGKSLRQGLPLEALAIQQGVPAYLADLLATPELAPYVDRDELLQIVRSPAAEGRAFKSVLRPMMLAYWLRHRQDKKSEKSAINRII